MSFCPSDSLWCQLSLKDGDNFVSPYSQYR